MFSKDCHKTQPFLNISWLKPYEIKMKMNSLSNIIFHCFTLICLKDCISHVRLDVIQIVLLLPDCCKCI